MTPKKVFEIAKRVYDAYPHTKKEKAGCAGAIAKMDGIRFERVKRLVEEEREKEEEVVHIEDSPDAVFKGEIKFNQLT